MKCKRVKGLKEISNNNKRIGTLEQIRSYNTIKLSSLNPSRFEYKRVTGNFSSVQKTPNNRYLNFRYTDSYVRRGFGISLFDNMPLKMQSHKPIPLRDHSYKCVYSLRTKASHMKGIGIII